MSVEFLFISLLILVCATDVIPSQLDGPIFPSWRGRYLDEKIVGGQSTTIEDYPHQVSLELYGRHNCGGSIISEVYIVTAAHCLRAPISAYSVRAGSTYVGSGGFTSRISQIYRHPYYNKKFDYDIGIVRLSNPLSFSTSIRPIRLASPNQVIGEGVYSVVTGWGRLQSGGQAPPNLQAVTLPIVGQAKCRYLYYYVNPITDRMICAGFDEGGKASCQGDSGGPVVINNELVGIVSWAAGCAKPNYPSVFASIPALRSFITYITGI